MTVEVAILGGGKIGEALLSGLLRGGRDAAAVVVSERYPDRAEYLVETYGVAVVQPVEAAAARTVLVAVKPQDVDPVLAQLAPAVRPDHLVVSVAAGIMIEQLEAALPKGTAVVRAMPNTPALVGEGMTAIAAGAHAGDAHLETAEALLAAVGKVVRVPESQLDAVTALSGSGPAYFFYVVEALVDAGVLLGLPRVLATELAVQTALGLAVMLRDSGQAPAQLREAVTSPAGTTAAGLRALEVHGVRAAMLGAVEAAAMRSAELGTRS